MSTYVSVYAHHSDKHQYLHQHTSILVFRVCHCIMLTQYIIWSSVLKQVKCLLRSLRMQLFEFVELNLGDNLEIAGHLVVKMVEESQQSLLRSSMTQNSFESVKLYSGDGLEMAGCHTVIFSLVGFQGEFKLREVPISGRSVTLEWYILHKCASYVGTQDDACDCTRWLSRPPR